MLISDVLSNPMNTPKTPSPTEGKSEEEMVKKAKHDSLKIAFLLKERYFPRKDEAEYLGAVIDHWLSIIATHNEWLRQEIEKLKQKKLEGGRSSRHSDLRVWRNDRINETLDDVLALLSTKPQSHE